MSRVLLKLSGESFADTSTNFGIDPRVIERIASEITQANNEDIQIGVVVGGGNFFRGGLLPSYKHTDSYSPAILK